MDKHHRVRINNNKVSNKTGRPTRYAQRTLLEHPDLVRKETVPLGHTGHLIDKATLSRLKVIADLPNI